MLAVLAVLVGPSGPALAQVDDYLGTPIASVRLEIAGQVVSDPAVIDLVETRVGQPLAMVHVRATIAHLVTLGRFDDIEVEAVHGERGVALVYRLTPARVIAGVDFHGRTELPARRLRRLVRERFGSSPGAGRVDDIVAAIAEAYRAGGYFRATIVPAVGPADARGRSRLVLDIDTGPRARIARASVAGQPPQGRDRLLADLRLTPGRPWVAREVEERVERAVARLRASGYYEAHLDLTSRVSDAGTEVEVAVTVDAGPLVELAFEGDPLPRGRQEALVPIQREGSVDEDLLEDSKRRIEDSLHAQGYWRAVVDYRRSEGDGRLRVVFSVTRGRQYFVSRVEMSGVVSLPRPELDALVRTRAGAPFVQATLDADVAAVAQRYRARGFTAVQVTGRADAPSVADVASTQPDTALVEPRIVVEEGPRTLVGQVILSGRAAVPERELRQVLTLSPGAAFFAPQLSADRSALLRAYLNRGYRDAAVEAQAVPQADTQTVDVVFTVTEGPQAIVDRVIVVGNSRTALDTIHRELRLRPGDPVGLEALGEAQRRLAALGLFRRVRVEDRAPPGQVRRDVVVTVDEAPATSIGYGAGLEVGERLRRSDQPDAPAVERIEVAPRGFFEVGRRNLWGKNRSVNLFTRVSVRRSNDGGAETDRGQLGFNEYRVVAAWREPRVLGWNVDGQVAAFAEQAIRSSFSYRRRGVNADVSRHLSPRLTLLGRYAFGQTDLFDARYNPTDQPLIDRLFPQVRLSTLSGGFVHDVRDDPLDPARGHLLSVDAATALRALGSEVGYVKGLGEAFVYRPLSRARRVVFAAGARLGLATGFERSVRRVSNGDEVVEVVKDLPASERFYAGGDTTVRGFSQDRLGDTGTIDQDGFPTGGNAVVIVNAELRFPVWRAVGGAVFTDAGNVFLKASDVEIGRLRGTGGVGIRYRSPIGPIRVDLGFKFDRRVSPAGTLERPYVVHISLGQAF